MLFWRWIKTALDSMVRGGFAENDRKVIQPERSGVCQSNYHPAFRGRLADMQSNAEMRPLGAAHFRQRRSCEHFFTVRTFQRDRQRKSLLGVGAGIERKVIPLAGFQVYFSHV